MEDSDLSLYVFIALIAVTVGLAFYAGKWFEDRRWKALIPAQMEQLCTECASINQ